MRENELLKNVLKNHPEMAPKTKIQELTVEWIFRVPKSGHILSSQVHEFPFLHGSQHRFIVETSLALASIDRHTPGYAVKMIEEISKIPGDGVEALDNLIQIVGEVMVTKRCSDFCDHNSLEHEPKASKTTKNPELRCSKRGVFFAVEVKTPRLTEYAQTRLGALQLTARFPDELRRVSEVGETCVTANDNKVMGNLANANKKFEAYAKNPAFKDDYRIVFFIWDDHIYEPIAALKSPMSGLFTDKSFYKDESGVPVDFRFIDGVILVRNQHNLIRSIKNLPLVNNANNTYQFPAGVFYSAFIQNPNGRPIPDDIIQAFGADDPSNDRCASEYQTVELINWRSEIGIKGLHQLSPVDQERLISEVKKLSGGELRASDKDVSTFSCINVDQHDNVDSIIATMEIAERMQSNINKMDVAQWAGFGNTTMYGGTKRITVDGKKIPRTGRNSPCPCGSNKKFKKCCIDLIDY